MRKREFVKYAVYSGLGLRCMPVGIGWSDQSGKQNKSVSIMELKQASYVVETPKGLRCLICPNECTLKEGELSECHNRRVMDGKLYTLAYNHPCAIHIDPIEKKPLFHYLPGKKAFSFGTAGCNFMCLNCQNAEISQVSPEDITSYNLTPAELVRSARESSCETIAYTYTEPISYFEYMLDTARLARSAGIRNLMISNGFINEKPLQDLLPFLDAANIDLKAFDDLTYQRLTGGSLQPVLETLKAIRDAGVWLEITNLIVPEWSDDLQMIEKMCRWLAKNGLAQYPLHFSRFHPAYKLKHLKPTPLNTMLEAKNIALAQGIDHVYIGNVPEYDGENTVCPNCQSVLIRRKGFAILENKLSNGLCQACQTPVPGVWSL